jgi:hypothetical protein
VLRGLADSGGQVALLIVDHNLSGSPGPTSSPAPTKCTRWPNVCSWWNATTRRGARSSRP